MRPLYFLPALLFCLSISSRAQSLQVPFFSAPRPGVAQTTSSRIGGRAFIKSIDTLGFEAREEMIIQQILSGNIPDSLKFFKKIAFERDGHSVEIWALPDYLAIGTNEDFIRMPMGPVAAQIIADSLYCSLPTAYLVDKIAEASEGAIDPFPFRPFGFRNCWPLTFEDSNNAINALYKSKGYHFGQLISGLKKDIILSCKITDSLRYNNVVIYGWHYPDGTHIQPSYNGHVSYYVDYSHGIRLIYRTIKIDGRDYDLKSVLESQTLYHLLSDEPRPIHPASYDTHHPTSSPSGYPHSKPVVTR